MWNGTSTVSPRRCLDETPRRGIIGDRWADRCLLWETIFLLAVSLGQSCLLYTSDAADDTINV